MTTIWKPSGTQTIYPNSVVDRRWFLNQGLASNVDGRWKNDDSQAYTGLSTPRKRVSCSMD